MVKNGEAGKQVCGSVEAVQKQPRGLQAVAEWPCRL